MSKTDLVIFMAEESGLTKADSARALDAMVKGLEQGLKESVKVTLTGILKFTSKEKPESTGRNPRTGEAVKIAARTAVTIKAGSKLKEALN
ncbi:MAG: HU family DNA-binding protein [Bacilli bacterium]